ncbi:hypothetical protein ACFLWX_01865 [Chloroflexota bacterium]
MRKIIKDGIVTGFFNEANKINTKDNFLDSLNNSGVPRCTIETKRGRIINVKVDESDRVFPTSPDYIISLKHYLDDHGYTLQMMGDML